MSDKRIQFSNIVHNQLPSYVKEEFPLVSEFLSQYYLSQEFQGAPIDLIQNIDRYIKVDQITSQAESAILLDNISSFDSTIFVGVSSTPTGTNGFPDSYGLLKIDDEIITYTGKTFNSFTGCIRGFSGISSYISSNQPDQLVFSKSESTEHSSGSTIVNLSSLFLKEFLLKIKNQLTPGFENREFVEELNNSLFIKQSKDFYRSKGTDQSFEILFKSLYGENVSIIRPKEYLFRPSDAQFQITNDLVVESIEGNPENLENSTLFQDEFLNFTKAYAPITKVEKIRSKEGKEYYKLSFDSGYNKDITFDGALYGEFKVHPQTKVIGQYNANFVNQLTTLNVDSTIGFPYNGELSVMYDDQSKGVITYTSKNINQFFGCSNITGTINDSSNIGINTYARDFDNLIKVRITSVIKDLNLIDDTYYLKKGYTSQIKTLGVKSEDIVSNNWFFNISTSYDVDFISLIDDSDKTYRVNTKLNHIFRIGDSLKIIDNSGIERNSTIIDVVSEKSFNIKGQGELVITNSYTVKRNILKTNSSTFPTIDVYNANVQNIYKDKDKTIVASPSLPYYNNQSLNVSSGQIIFSGTFDSDTFRITSSTDHGFYTGDLVYYTPEKIITESFNEDGSIIETLQIQSKLFDEGIYFIKRIDSNNVKLAKSRSNIYDSKFVSVDNPVTVNSNTLEYYKFKSKRLQSQNLFREISSPINDGAEYPTEPGFTGILINGVEILNYKSRDIVYYGSLNEIEVTAPGINYDVINPPILSISDPAGSGATAHCSIRGSLNQIRVVDPGFDYVEIPSIRITGGNGVGAKAYAGMKLVDHQSNFNSEINSMQVSLVSNIVGFNTYHKFRNTERIIYDTKGQRGVGGISTDSSYFVSVQSPTTVKLHNTLGDAISGINTINLTSHGIGDHEFRSFNKKSILGSVNIENSGSGYQNKKKTVLSSVTGINTSINQINISNHEFESGEVVKYSTNGSIIGGLTNNTEYYLTKVSNDSFNLSPIGTGSVENNFYYATKQFINLTSIGSGIQSFNYPEISVEVIGNVGISSIGTTTFKAVIQPIFRGEVVSVHLESTGSNYGSSEILNYNRQPLVTLNSGSGAKVIPIISNGRIIEVLVNSSGNGYNSPPSLIIDGEGFGAVLTPIIENGQLIKVNIIESGIGYLPGTTIINVIAAGLSAEFNTKIQSWNVNLFQKNSTIVSDDDGFLSEGINQNFELEYSHLYAPRKLREIVYASNQSGNILYGIKDLIKSGNKEVSSNEHSPIIGWAYDGNPIYGPYGYSTKQGGIISQMKSGYKLDLKPNRPSVSTFPAGFFIQDYSHFEVSDENVLDKNNGRFCITPEYPNGAYVYFSTISISDADSSGPFSGYKSPVFPYLIGDNFNSKPNEFNFKPSSNQNDLDLNQTNFSRNTNPYNLIENASSYAYLDVPNLLNQTADIKYATTGYIEKINISSGGYEYKVGDKLVFDNEGTGGFNASAEVERISGRSIDSISVATTSISNVEFYPTTSQGNFLVFSENPHNFTNSDLIVVSGLNTTSSLIEGSYIIGITTNTIALTAGIGSTAITGIVTYFSVAGNLNYSNIRENDILSIGTEQIKVLNVDARSSRIRVLRAINGTVGSSHSVTDVLYENSRKFIINAGFRSQYDYKVNREIYFNPIDAVGIGTISGIGIGATLIFSNPGVGITQIFIPTRSIYIPNHQLNTGDELIYSTNNGSVIGVSTNGISTSVSLLNQSIVYVAKISDDLIGISTFKVGLGTGGTFVGITSQTSGTGILYFTSIGTGENHSFKTTYNGLFGDILKNVVTVSTAQTHGLLNGDTVFIDVNPSTSTTFTFKYNDYNRKLLVNPKDFISAGINTITNTITIIDHKFESGQKVIHTATTPAIGLENNREYFIFVVDTNNIRLTNNYYDSINAKPNIVGITSASDGTLSAINPPIQVYKDSSVIFDLSDSSLSYNQQSTLYPAFDLKFFNDSNFTKNYNSSSNSTVFEVQKVGTVGVTNDAKVILSVNENTPENLYYNLIPIYDGNLPENKKLITEDREVLSNNKIQILNSQYNGEYTITVGSSTLFTYDVAKVPEEDLYISGISSIKYDTNSPNTNGSISKIKILNRGQNYYSLPRILSVTSEIGTGQILEPSSTSIGKIKSIKINDIGFDFPSDLTMRPSVAIPQVGKVIPLASLESITISSFGKGYISAPKLIVLDGKTGNISPEIDLKFTLGNNKIEILKNTFGLNNVTPTILPIQNSNGVGISDIQYDPITKNVTVVLSVGFSTANSFPFAVNDKVLIENISVDVTSAGKGFNSENYNYQLFTLTTVTENIGGLGGSVTYNLNEFLNNSESPGTFDPNNSSGRIIAQKHFPIFDVVLRKNNYLIGETVISESSTGIVEDWDSKLDFIKVLSKNNFKVGEIIKGSSSKTQGVIFSIDEFDAFFDLAATSKFVSGRQSDAGVLNENLQRIQDSLYYQNFSYAIKSRVAFDTWNDVVSTLNHTVGFVKFSDYQLESNLNVEDSNSLAVNLTSDLTSVEVISDIISVVNLNCVYDFDLVRENSLEIGSQIFSDEIIFSNRILTDYAESIGNRVLLIDDISSQFNSIRQAFNLTHKNNPIFERYFEGNSSTIININSDVIYIPDHFFVTGEEVRYINAGAGTSQAIGIAATTFAGVGLTDKLPDSVHIVKVDTNNIKLARSAENALNRIPKTLDITSVGIGSSHKFVSTNQNAKVIVALDNFIQSPIVSTATTTTLAGDVFTTSDIIFLNEINSFFDGDLIKIGNEIMKVEGVSIGSTNAIQVLRSRLGTSIAGYSTGSLVTKVSGNYNIVNNVLNFAEPPFGNIPLSSPTNLPDERDWVGISTGSSFQGRSFIRSGIVDSSEETYHKNYIFNDISSGFNGIAKKFTLKFNETDVEGIVDKNAVILINGIFQGPGITHDYNLTESVGVTTITFTGAAASVSYDINNASIPRGGVIVSVGSTEGFGYQPLVSAGGTASVSIAGTISAISIGNSGSGYRSGVQIVKVGVALSSTGIPSIEFIGTASVSNGRVVSIAITNPGSGYTSTNPPYVIFDDPLSYSNLPLIYRYSSSGVGTQATVNVVVGQGSSVIDFEIINTGYGYVANQILTVPIGGPTGIPTTGASFKEFEVTIEKTFTDKFSGWSIGELQVLDSLDDEFDGKSVSFPIRLSGDLISILSSKGSNINVQDTLLIFINDVLQIPGSGYIFPGGSIITFTEPPKIGDTSKILFYRGSGSVDVVDVDILETVKIGDGLTIGYDSFIGQSPTLQEQERTVTRINSTDLVSTNPYFGPGNVVDETFERPLLWCRQTEDKVIDELPIGKDRILYEAAITPTSYLIQPVGVGSTVLCVDTIRPFFNSIQESDTSLTFQNSITIISQDNKVGASATAVVSIAGTISSIVLSDGGVGYTTTPSVSIQDSVGIGTTIPVNATVEAFISSGIITAINVINPGVGYTFTNSPIVLIEPPSFQTEIDDVNDYKGDSGVIVGFGTTTISGTDKIIFDFYIPTNSYLRETSTSFPFGVYVETAITVSSIDVNDYFLVYGSNVGSEFSGITSLDNIDNIIGIGTNFVDNIYQVESVSNVSVANTTIGIETVGTATTIVRRISAKISNISNVTGYSGIATSYNFGNFSWGKIMLTARTKENSYNFYGNNGVSGISTSGVVKRTLPLRFKK